MTGVQTCALPISNIVFNDNPTEFDDNLGITLGLVVIGASPSVTNLNSDMYASSLTITASDELRTKGYEVDIGTGGISIAGTMTTTDTGESDGSIITTEGNLSISSGGVYTKDTATEFWFDGSGTSTWTDSNSTKQDMGTVYVDGSTKTVNLGSSVNATQLTLGANDTLGLGSSGYVLTLLGVGVDASRPFVVESGGTLNEGTDSKVLFTGSSADLEVQAETYHDLEISPAATASYTQYLAVTTSETVNVSGDLTIGNGTNTTVANVTGNDPTLNVDGNVVISANATLSASDSASFTVAGNWTNSNVFTHNSGTVTFDGAANQTATTNAQAFGNLILNNTGDTPGTNDKLILSGNLTVAIDLTVTDGTLDLTTNDPVTDVGDDVSIASNGNILASDSSAFTVAGNWSNSGAFTHNNGTVTFDAGDTGNTIDGNISSAKIGRAHV